jgi:hypothetical protein
MYKILIIGAGQLGSRHLQGVMKSKHCLNITVVDPSPESLENAKKCEDEVIFGNELSTVSYSKSIPVIQDEYDVAIIATTAGVRATVTRELLQKNKVKHIIFEKVLFQKLEEYQIVDELLQQHNTKGWVNCPRRIYPTYQKIKKLLSDEVKVDMEVVGNSWGLACNSIHFIDLYAYLTSVTEFNLSTTGLDLKSIKSKRNGFYEATGKLQGETKKGRFELICGVNESVNCSINLKTPNYDIHINELEGFYTYQKEESVVKEEHITLYQSQLSGLNIDELISSNSSSLTNFKESCAIHTPFIKSMHEYFELSLGEKLAACPIT